MSLLCDKGDGDDSPNDRCTESYENTLLCYVSHKMDIVPHEKLVKIVAEFYTDYEIKVAKDLVFEKLAKGKRNIVRKGQDKAAMNISDMLEVLHKTDPENMPRFGTFDLNRLPSLDLDTVDMVSVHKDIKQLKDIWSSDVVSDKVGEIQAELVAVKSGMEAISAQLSQVVNHIRSKDESYAGVVSSTQFPPLSVENCSRSVAREEPVRSAIPFSMSPVRTDARNGVEWKSSPLKSASPVRAEPLARRPRSDFDDGSNRIKPKTTLDPVLHRQDGLETNTQDKNDPESFTLVKRKKKARQNVIVGTCGVDGNIRSKGRSF